MSKTAAEYIDIKQLKPWDKNPRKNDHAVIEVKQSIERFGFSSPIIARKSDNVIIAGHTRWKAAKEIGLKEVPVRFMDLDVVDSQLLAIADNKLNERADWDEDLLEQVLQDLAGEDLSGIGFDDNELQDIIDKASDTDTKEENEDLPELEEEVHSKEGEIYELGPHRLICGDSTKKENWNLLLDGEKVDMVFTDPPYGMNYGGGRGKKQFGEILNDELQNEELINLVKEPLENLKLFGCEIFYVCLTWRFMKEFQIAFNRINLSINSCIVWNKLSIGLGHQDYRPQHEFILYSNISNTKIIDRSLSDVWNIKRDNHQSYIHPTQKPITVAEEAIKNSTIKSDIVADAFGGSGSTLIAADKLNRYARLIELDPKYCDAIRRRWTRYATENGLEVGSGGLE